MVVTDWQSKPEYSKSKFLHFFLISLLTVSIFFILYLFRFVDDNRLTSWKWIFADVAVVRLFLFFLFGIIIAYVFSRFLIPERNPLIFLFLSSFIITTFFWKEPEVIVDTSRYFTQAKHLKIYGIKYFIKEWGRDINAWTDLPLVPFLYGLIFKFFGELRTHIQIFTTLLFSMTVVLTYLIGKTLWNEEVGFFAGIFLLGMPYLFTQVPLMLVDIPTMFFLTFSIFAFIKALDRGGIWVAISSVAIFLTAFSKYSTWLMLSVLVIIFLVYLIIQNTEHKTINPKSRTRYFYRGILIALITGTLIGIVVLFKFDVISGQFNLLLDYQKPGLKRWGEGYISTFFYQIHPFITIAALFSLYVAFKKRDLKYLVICWLILLILLLQIKRIRYTIPIFPMFTLMASYGLQEIKNTGLKRFVALCAVISSLIVAIFVYLPFLQRMSPVNLKNAGRFLNSIDATAIEVLTLTDRPVVNPAISVPILDLFTKKDIYYHYDTDFSPPFEKIRESPLRFTWEYKNPRYYNDKKLKDTVAVVIISNRMDEPLPKHFMERLKGYKKAKVFDSSTGLFSYSPMVRIYLASPS